MELLNYTVMSIFHNWKNWQTDLQSSGIIKHHYVDSTFSIFSKISYLYSLMNSLVKEIGYPNEILICCSLMSNDVENFLWPLVVFSNTFWEKCLFNSSAHFFQ